jgi:tRNA(Ile)-lysidine synthase
MVQDVIERVAATVARYRMFSPGQRVGVAVSGGADSVCLLHILIELAPRWDLRLSVLHLDHMLRGEESCRDAEFVRDLARKLGLFVQIAQAEVAAMARATGDNLEQAARRARQDFFRKYLDSGALDRIALGHTRSDQAETVLFRFLRGAGSAGLAGIRPITENGFVRPLIDIERGEVEAFLRERALPWREDSTNRSLDFARNRIRHELLPALTADWNPRLTETLAHTAKWALAEEAWWDAEIARLAQEHLTVKLPAVLMRAEAVASLDLAVARRLVRRAIELAKGDLRAVGFEHVEQVLGIASQPQGHGRLQIPGLDVFRSFDWIRLAPPGRERERNYRLPLTVPGRVQVPGSEALIAIELIQGDCVYNDSVSCVDWHRVSGTLELRNRRPGDQYRPVGHSHPEKIKTLFQNMRIPLWERRDWPVITSGDAIIWSRLFGPAADYAADSTSRAILEIRELAC